MSDAQQLINPLTGLPIDDNDIQSLATLAEEQVKLEDEISVLADQVKSKGERARYLSEVLIPNKLDDLGMTEFRMSSGYKVQVKPFYSCKILNDEAYVWLDENGHGGLIKTQVIRDYSRTEREAAIEFAKTNPGFTLKEGVHYQTITAFTKEIYTRNETLPTEFFTVFQGKKTKITR